MNTDFLYRMIHEKEPDFFEMSDAIWGYAEPAYEEVQSSCIQIKKLRLEGFEITEAIGNIQTAFKASYGTGKPIIALLGEFDALPNLSQMADVTKPCSEISEAANISGTYGHGCGHQLLGTACAEAAVAIKDYMQKEQLQGTIVYYGCPAEEGGAGKAFMVRSGCFDDCDIALTWHPYAVTCGSISTLASARVYYDFTGISSHAAVSPHLGRSALDAVELMNVGVNYLREHIIPEARVHYAVTNSGGDAPNVVQANAQVLYSVRAPQNDQMCDLLERVHCIAKGAAMMTGTNVHIQVVSAYADVLQNKTLDRLVYENLKKIYPVAYNDNDIEYAKNFYEVGNKTEISTYKGMAKKFLGEKADGFFNGVMDDLVIPPMPLKMGSTDVGDVSWNMPTAWFNGATFALGTASHSWQAVAQGKSSIAHKGMSAAATVLSLTAIELLERPELIQSAKQDFLEVLNGRTYNSIIPPDVEPGMINRKQKEKIR